MKLFISHSSALFLIRQERRYGHGRADAKRVSFLPDMGKPSEVDYLMESPALCRLPQPVHYLVKREQRRTDIAHQIRHSVCHPPSARSFTKVLRNVYYSSPELCFVQLASDYDLIWLIYLGFELCGRYVLSEDPETDTEYHVEPVTSVRRLQRFIECNSQLVGSKKARRALRYIRPNSYSPMETVLVMLLCLPVMLGGYGLPWPLLNHEVQIINVYGRKSTRRCDLYWPEAKIAIEYDSNEFHVPGTKWQEDSARRVDLGLRDIEVVSVGPKQLERAYEMEKLARLITKRLPQRFGGRNFVYSGARQRLRRELMPWVRD